MQLTTPSSEIAPLQPPHQMLPPTDYYNLSSAMIDSTEPSIVYFAQNPGQFIGNSEGYLHRVVIRRWNKLMWKSSASPNSFHAQPLVNSNAISTIILAPRRYFSSGRIHQPPIDISSLSCVILSTIRDGGLRRFRLARLVAPVMSKGFHPLSHPQN
jgi:hypothetical protein